MKTPTLLPIASKAFILFSTLAILAVSIMAFNDPQSVMSLVHVELNNTDAYSSIRGIYGGVGLTICISLLYLIKKHVQQALAFLTLLWGSYALSRITTFFVDGPLGSFGIQWLIIEAILCIIGIALCWLNTSSTHPN